MKSMDFEVKMFEQKYGKADEAPAETTEQTTDEAAAETTATTEATVEQTETTTEETPPVEDKTPAEVPIQELPDVSFLKEIGFDSIEAFKSKWTELNEATSKQPEFKEPEFVNDQSRELYELIVNGKEDDVAEILYTRKQLAKLEGETDESKILKAFIKMQNPEFDEADVEDEFKETYSLSEDAEFDESKKRREEKKLRQNIKTDVLKAKEFFAQKRAELKLPTTEKVTAQPDNSESQDDVFVQLLAENIKNFNGLTPIEFEHKDENTSIPIKYEWDSNKVSELKAQLEQPHGYYSLLATRHYDGEKYNTTQIVEDMYVLNNWKSMLDAAVSQAVNKTKIEFLKAQKGINDKVPTERALPSEIQADPVKDEYRKIFS
jgi:hypothetical protein